MMSLGNNGAIIQNSKFYRITMPIGVGMAFMVTYLNIFLYNDIGMGTEGLALATLLSVVTFNVFKLWFVNKKLKMFPYTMKTLQMVLIIIVLFLGSYFWNFSVPEFSIRSFRIDPIVNIILKSLIIIPVYLFVVFKLTISDQINSLVNRFIK